MLFRQLFEKNSSTYTYLIADKLSKQAVLIDPVIDETDGYIRLLNELGLTLKVAMDTHTHADHITALGKLQTLPVPMTAFMMAVKLRSAISNSPPYTLRGIPMIPIAFN